MIKKRLLAFFLAMSFALSVLASYTQAAVADDDFQSAQTEGAYDPLREKVTQILAGADKLYVHEIDRDSLDIDLTSGDTDDALNEMKEAVQIDPDEIVPVIIILDEESVIEQDSFAEPDAVSFMLADELADGQDKIIEEIESYVLNGKALDIEYQYTWLLNGIAAQIPYGKISEIEALDGVKNVVVQRVYSPMTTGSYSPLTVSDGVMIGREETWDIGYYGEGTKIAVIDTGLDDDHPNFAALPGDVLTDSSADVETIEEVLTQLHAYSGYRGGLTAESLYRSTKVPYGYNYVDESLRIDHSGDNQGTHGTHVAGIAAANKIDSSEVVGVAPNAQLYIMKVFGANGGAYDADLLASIEDALLLGADVINMSLGSAAGFTTDGDVIDQVYARVGTTGTILSISAGNSGAMGQGNFWDTDTNLTSNPDNSTISSPSTYQNTLSVASVENVGIYGYYLEVNGKKYVLTEGTGASNKSTSTLAGQELQFAAVGNLGQTLNDFINADVAGKVALVERGITDFASKCDLAAEAGAVACIVYNNAVGSFGMDMKGAESTIPCASISRSDGLDLLAVLAQDSGAVMTFSDDLGSGANELAWQISDFSSWGVAPDLTLRPDISAPGGNIYSTVDGGGYETMSGTSMAAPNLSGISALVVQYVREKYPELADKELRDFVNSLLMSTAEALPYGTDGLYFSPRSQGAGIANAYSAVSTGAILHVEGSDLPKVELFDDPDKTGVYTYSFDVENFSDEDLIYSLSTVVQTEAVEYDEDGRSYMALAPYELDADIDVNLIYDYNTNGNINSHDAYVLWKALKDGNLPGSSYLRYDVLLDGTVDNDDVQAYLDELVEKDRTDANGDDIDLWEQSSGLLTVPAGSTETVTVTITVSDESKAYMDANFENGIYVEGYTFLTALDDDGVDLSIPYMGFYGDWTQAPIIDSAYYWDDFALEFTEEPTGSQYFNVLFTQPDSWGWQPGLNPYFYYMEEFDPAHISLSPNGDGYAEYIDDIYLSLLRNANTLSFKYTDSETGEVLFEEVIDHVSKSYFNDSYGMILPFIYSWYAYPYDMTDANGEPLADGTKVTLSVEAALDYDVEGRKSANLNSVWNTDITIDNTAPVMYDAAFAELDGQQYVTLTMHDAVSVAAVSFLNRRETFIYDQYPTVDDGVDGILDDDGNIIYYVEGTPAKDGGVDYLIVANVTGYGNEFALVLGDYAFNESAYLLETENNDPVLDDDLLYGYRVFDEAISNDSLYGWLSIDPDTANAVQMDTEYFMDYAIDAAEYVDGYILAVDTSYVVNDYSNLVWIKPGYWEDRHTITTIDGGISELALDPTTGMLYGITGINTWPSSALVTIDPVTGYKETVSQDWWAPSLNAFGMTAGTDGTLYAVNANGELRTINKETGDWNDEVLLDTTAVTGGVLEYGQSMTFDDDNNCIYWAYYGYGNSGTLYRIDDPDGSPVITEVGAIAGNAEVVGLLRMDDRGYHLPESELLDLYFTEDSISLVIGNSGAFEVVGNPWYMTPEKMEWSTSDESVATVSGSGVVRAVGVGDAVITAKTPDGKFTLTGTVTVTRPKAQLYGYIYGGDVWATFAAADPAGTAYELSDEVLYVDYTAGEYFDGYVYAFDDSQAFYRIDAQTFEATKLANTRSDLQVADMAYDYTTGFMYGIVLNSYTYLYELVHIDIQSGAVETVCQLPDYLYTTGGLAIDNDGTLYTVDAYGALCTIDAETGELTTVGLTGHDAPSLASMAYDYVNDELYMADETGVFYINTETGAASLMGNVGYYTTVLCMYAIPDEIPERDYVPVEDVVLDSASLSILTGMSRRVPVTVYPFNATDRDVDWTVADTKVALIENGNIYGVSVGTTTATGTLEGHTVTLDIKVLPSAGELYSYVIYDIAGYADHFWAVFDDTDPSGEGGGLAQNNDYEVDAAEYYNGLIYASALNSYTYDMNFVVFDPNDEYSVVWSAVMDYDLHDMAFDYTEGVMYAIGGQRNADGNNLFTVDIDTGDCYLVGATDETLVALACLSDGTLVGVGESGSFYRVDKTSGKLDYVADTGYTSSGIQSMAYDHNTGNLYWAQFYQGGFDPITWTMTPASSALLLVDPEDGSVTDLGVLGLFGCMVSGLYTVPSDPPTVGTPEITGIQIANGSTAMLAEDGTVQLVAKLTPVSVSLRDKQIDYASDNTDVATVSDTGLVTGHAAGTATITASYGSFSTTIKITVVDDSTKLYVVSSSNMESYPLFKPNNKETGVDLDVEGELIAAAYNGSDGYFYGVSKDGWLWKYTIDGEVEKIGSAPVTELVSNLADLNESIENSWGYYTGVYPVDIVYNSFDGEMYLAAGVGFIADDRDLVDMPYLYRLDVTTGEGEMICSIANNYGELRAHAITFVSATEYLIYSGYDDTIFRAAIGDDYAAAISWPQREFVASEYIGMVYSAELNMVFFAAVDTYYHSGPVLYALNPDTGIYFMVGEADYSYNMVDLILIEGMEPVTVDGLADDEEEPDSIDDEEGPDSISDDSIGDEEDSDPLYDES